MEVSPEENMCGRGVARTTMKACHETLQPRGRNYLSKLSKRGGNHHGSISTSSSSSSSSAGGTGPCTSGEGDGLKTGIMGPKVGEGMSRCLRCSVSSPTLAYREHDLTSFRTSLLPLLASSSHNMSLAMLLGYYMTYAAIGLACH